MMNIFYKDKKYYSFAILSLILLAVLAVLAPILISNTKENWNDILNSEIVQIESEVIKLIDSKSKAITNDLNKLESVISKAKFDSSNISENLFELINNYESTNYIALYNSDTLRAWNSNTFDFPNYNVIAKENLSGFYFYNTDLYTFLLSSKKIKIQDVEFLLLEAEPVQKNYRMSGLHFKELDFLKAVSEKYEIELTLLLKSDIAKQKDGRFYNFSLSANNNLNGFVSFQKPLLDIRLNKINTTIKGLQTIAAIFIIVFLFAVLRNKINAIRKIYIRYIIYAASILGLRVFLFLVGFPSDVISSDLLLSTYFSSTFGFGIVKSPLELFISTVGLLSVAALGFYYQWKFFQSNKKNRFNSKYSLLIPILAIPSILLIIRALGSTIRSVVFDSTLLYFAELNLIPAPPIILMNLNILLLGLFTFLICIIMINSLQLFIKRFIKNELIGIIIIGVTVIILAVLYHWSQLQPQVPVPTKIIFLLLTVAVAFYFAKIKSSRSLILFLGALIASITSVLLMNYYNSELERESQKEYAVDISRQKGNWYEFIVRDNLSDDVNLNLVKDALLNKLSNKNTVAFKIWAKSALQKNALNSKVAILDNNFNTLGKFTFDYTNSQNLINLKAKLEDIPIVEKRQYPFDNKTYIIGLTKIINQQKTIGYLNTEVYYDMDEINLIKSPKFIVSNNQFANLAIDFNQLRIYDFYNNKLQSSFGEIDLSLENKSRILNADYNKFNESWMHLNMGGIPHLVYLYKSNPDESERVVAVALEEKNLSFSLFHFFKVFLIHVLFIIVSVLVYCAYILIRHKKIETGFRTKLLVAFLVISIIPLILMAVYFQGITIEKNIAAIDYKLKKRAVSIVEYLDANPYSDAQSLKKVLKNAEKDLSISFTIFSDDSIFYSSEMKYYDIGLIPKLPNSIAYNMIYNKGESTYLASEYVQNYPLNSIYYAAEFGGKTYIIKVSDVFNPILLPMSSTEISVFLFGSYSLAAILIIAVSTFLANQISSPIRKLTSATKSVASGDFGLELIEDTKGELQTLVDSFNTMVKQLKKSQTDLAEIERESAWKEMAKQVAHEIKNPLTPMKLSIQQLIIAHKDKHPKFDEIFNKVTETQISQIETLVRIATEFSNFARMPKLKLEEVNLVKIANDVVALFSDEKANVSVSSDVDIALVTADEDQFKRLFINLIRNSIQAKASIIELSIETKEKEFYIRLKDNGSGIPKEIMEKIFEKDFTTKIHGMGIGLSMAKRFIEIIGGEICVEESSNLGTTILIKIIKHN